MGNASVKARGHGHKRSGHKRSGHKRSGHKRSRHAFRTRRHRRFGGGPNGTLSPLNPEGKDKQSKKSRSKIKIHNVGEEMPLSKFVIIKSAHTAEQIGILARERKKKQQERDRTARRNQFFIEADTAKSERALRVKSRTNKPIIHISGSHK